MMRRLAWVPLLHARVNSALDGGVQSCLIEVSPDPLLRLVVFELQNPLSSRECWNAFQILAHAYAMANDCMIRKIRKRGKKGYVAEVCIKQLGGPKMDNDPFFMDEWKSGAQKRREQYMKMLRDKSAHIEKGSLS